VETAQSKKKMTTIAQESLAQDTVRAPMASTATAATAIAGSLALIAKQTSTIAMASRATTEEAAAMA